MVGMALPWRILSAGISPLWSPTAGWLPRQVPKFPKQFWHLLPCRDFPVALGGTMAPLRGLLSPGCVPGCVSHLSLPPSLSWGAEMSSKMPPRSFLQLLEVSSPVTP